MMVRNALVLVASTRAAAGVYEDTSGKILAEWLRGKGFSVPDPVIVADKEVPEYLARLLAQPEKLPRVLLTTGGTGISSDDLTVEAVAPFIETELPGVVHAFWTRGLATTPFAIMSRAVAGIVGKTFVMALPGSAGGCKDGIAVLDPILDSVVGQLEGGSCESTQHKGHGHCGMPADPPRVRAETGLVVGALITEEPLEVLAAAAANETVTSAMGALVTFNGVVRDHDGGQNVRSLTYSSHPMAEAELQKVIERISSQHPLTRLWAAHRVGPLAVGEAAFVVHSAAAHRSEAFDAASALVDAVKAEVPIWKEQELEDGSTQWVGLE